MRLHAWRLGLRGMTDTVFDPRRGGCVIPLPKLAQAEMATMLILAVHPDMTWQSATGLPAIRGGCR
jgi:hypothetical protein